MEHSYTLVCCERVARPPKSPEWGTCPPPPTPPSSQRPFYPGQKKCNISPQRFDSTAHLFHILDWSFSNYGSRQLKLCVDVCIEFGAIAPPHTPPHTPSPPMPMQIQVKARVSPHGAALPSITCSYRHTLYKCRKHKSNSWLVYFLNCPRVTLCWPT